MNDSFWNPSQGGNAAFPGFAVLCAIVFVASVFSIGGADKLRATNTVYSLASVISLVSRLNFPTVIVLPSSEIL